jgi:hypothetical protein
MAIWIFDGTPGSGKTQGAVEKIIANLKKGRKVYSNIEGHNDPECLEALKSMAGLSDIQFIEKFEYIPDEKCRQFYRYVDKGSLIVVDEAHKYFNVRKWADKENNDFAIWASTHRHYGYELLLITQNLNRIDSSVRELAEWTYRYKKSNFFGKKLGQNSYTVKTYPGEHASGKPLATNIKTYNSDIWKCYKSYVAKDIKEQGLMEHINILKHPAIIAIPILLCVFMLLAWHSTKKSSSIISKLKGEKIEFTKLPKIDEKGNVKVSEISKVEGNSQPGGADRKGSELVKVNVKDESGGKAQKIVPKVEGTEKRGVSPETIEKNIRDSVQEMREELKGKLIAIVDGKEIYGKKTK